MRPAPGPCVTPEGDLVLHGVTYFLTLAWACVAAGRVDGCDGGHTVRTLDAANAIKAAEPGLTPFSNSTWDTCVATYLFARMTPDQVKAIVTAQGLFAVETPSVMTKAEKSCVLAGSGL